VKSSVFWALVRKDLYVLRGLMIITVVVGLGALVGMRFGRIGFAIGGILFLTANVAGGIFMAMLSLLTERKEQSNLFALSLPISGFKYSLTKLVSAYLSYGIPWTVLTVIGLAGYFMPYAAADRGMFVYGLVLQLFVLALFSFVLAWLFIVSSEVLAGLVILISNIFFSLFMVTLNQPDVTNPLHSPHIVWTPFTLSAVIGELAVIALSIGLTLFALSRRRDHLRSL
jgi:ABC-2 type transport system permease protein